MEFTIAIEKLSNKTIDRLRDEACWDEVNQTVRDDEAEHAEFVRLVIAEAAKGNVTESVLRKNEKKEYAQACDAVAEMKQQLINAILR